MRVVILLGAMVFAVAATQVRAEQAARGGGARPVAESQRTVASAEAQVRVTFSSGEVGLIREHYASRFAGLPPGLQKKLARTGELPPGWQRKMEAFPVALERRLSPLPDGHARGVFEGHAVIYVPGTSVIIDAIVLF